MELINQFKESLESLGVSESTSKNYLSDLKFFYSWFYSIYKTPFSPTNLNPKILETYSSYNSGKLASSTVKRHISSINKFAQFLKDHDHIADNPLEKLGTNKPDKWELRKIKDYLYIQGASPVSIKNYMSDITQFLGWIEQVSLPGNNWVVEENTYAKLSPDLINEYKTRLISLNFSPSSINRKLSSLRKLASWAYKEGKIPENFLNQRPQFPFNARSSTTKLGEEAVESEADTASRIYSKFPPVRLIQRSLSALNRLYDFVVVETITDGLQLAGSIRQKKEVSITFASEATNIPRIQDPLKIANISKSFYDPLNVSTKHLSLVQKITHVVRFNRPKWYLRYHTYPIVHYVHFSILIVFMTMMGLGFYQKTIGLQASVLGASDSAPSRVLAIKQRILDSAGNPITAASNVRFAIYDDPKASDSALLWEEANSIDPDETGTFTTTVGEKEKIPSDIFRDYASLWLGLTVETSNELKPRTQLAQVSYAGNAQTLQSMGVADLQNYTNSVLALDSTGNLSIGGEISHTIESVYGQLTLSGNKLTLSTVLGTNSNVEIAPDGYGIIDLQKPIQNTSNNNNLLSAIGSVEFDDNVSILATSSSISAFTINQNDIGPLISAYANEIAKFTVDSLGNTTIAGDLSLSGNNPNIFASNPGSSLSISAKNNGALRLQPIASGDIEFFSPLNTLSSSGNLKLTGNLILASQSATTTLGGITYSWPTSSQTSGTFLKTNGSGVLSWSAMPDLTTIWNQTGGNVGIGNQVPNFRLDVSDSQSATGAAQISNTSTSNTAGGLIVKLGNTATTTDSNNKWITFEQAGIGIVGLIRGNTGTKGISYQSNGVADFAEYLRKSETDQIPFGSLLCLSIRGLVFSCNQDDQEIAGVASEHPAFVGGENLGNKSIAVGLAGQVSTRVANLNGNIEPGDSLMASRIPGVAVKANKGGQIVGRALSGFGSSDCSFDPSENFGLIENSDKICVGKIYILLNISYYEPSLAQKSNQFKNLTLNRTSQGLYELKDLLGETISKSEAIGSAMIGNLTAGLINAKRITVDTIDITGSLTYAGQDIRDYIAQALGNAPEIRSPIARLDQLETNVISPLSKNKDIKVKLNDTSALAIENSSGSAVARIDNAGNASFAGTLAAGQMEAQNIISDTASISGTLRAGKIIADSIEGLINTTPQSNFADISSMSANFVYVNNLRALTGNFEEGLIAQRPSTFTDISVFGQLKVDNSLILASNSINVLGTDLEIQSLRQGNLSLMAGLIYIDTQGNVRFGGNADFEKNVAIRGTLSANVISPLPNQDLTFRDSTSSSFLSINRQGDLSSSGSATFGKLNFNLVSPAFALSPTEVIATGSAGIASISIQQNEITIRNNLVTAKSLIYVTPRIDTGNTVLYLIRQVPGVSFTVGINTRLTKEIPFNWIIIN